MGFGDKLKGLRDQAQQAVADNKDRIQGAVQNVGEAANTRTHGKYADKIAKVGDRVSGGVEKLAHGGDQADTPATPVAEPDTPATPGAEPDAAATPAAEPDTPPAADQAPPEFE